MPIEKDLKPGDKWEFDGDVTAVFDDMLKRSIPEHDAMRSLCFDVGSKLVQNGTAIVDLGCSRGEALAPFIEKFGAFNGYVGVECSAPMLTAATKRFEGSVSNRLLRLHLQDLRKWFPPVTASLFLSVLTLQFIPITYRQKIIQQAFDALTPNGGLIVVEKIMGSDAAADDLLVNLYHAQKERAGYTRDEIDRKSLSLEGVLVPLTAAENERMLRAAGFRHVECFWRSLNFAGWVAIK